MSLIKKKTGGKRIKRKNLQLLKQTSLRKNKGSKKNFQIAVIITAAAESFLKPSPSRDQSYPGPLCGCVPARSKRSDAH